MRSSMIFIIIFFSSITWSQTRISVGEFKDKTGDSRCRVRWFSRVDLGDGFRDQIITTLKEQSGYKVYERENIKKIYSDEHELPNMDQSTALKKNKFKTTHYTITGAVTSFEMCADNVGGSVDVGGLFGIKNTGLKVGGSHSNAKVVLDLRVVDNETGEIVDSIKAEGTSASTGLNLKGDYKGSDFNSSGFKNTPIGEATRVAIEDAIKKVALVIPKNRADSQARETSSTTRSASKQRTPATKKSIVPSNQEIQNSVTTSENYCLMPDKKYTHLRLNKQTLWGFNTAKVFSSCRVLEKTQKGDRVSILDLNDSSKSFLKNEQIQKISPAGEGVKIGGRVTVIGDNPKLAIQCGVIDKTSSEYIVVCDKGEIVVPMSRAFVLLPH
jgi:curli biogenesis system outer membrane secretion channel CsgG